MINNKIRNLFIVLAAFSIFYFKMFPEIINQPVYANCIGAAERNCGVFPDATTCSQNGCTWDSTDTIPQPTSRFKPTKPPEDSGGGDDTGGGEGSGGGGDGTTATSNCVVTEIGTAATYNPETCNGAYTLPSKTYGNFGDPNCELATLSEAEKKDKFFTMFIDLGESQEHAHYWVDVIIMGESSFKPNNYNPSEEVYGLLQMDEKQVNRLQYPPYDIRFGNCEYTCQISNAVTYTKWYTNYFVNIEHINKNPPLTDYEKTHAKWNYWATAKYCWSFMGHHGICKI